MTRKGVVTGYSIHEGGRKLYKLGLRQKRKTTHYEVPEAPPVLYYASYVAGNYHLAKDRITAVKHAELYSGVLCVWNGAQWQMA